MKVEIKSITVLTDLFISEPMPTRTFYGSDYSNIISEILAGKLNNNNKQNE